MISKEVVVKGIDIKVKKIHEDDYINITDMAKYYNSEDPSGGGNKKLDV